MNETSGVIRDLRKPPLPGDIYHLGDNDHVTIISVELGQVRYAPGAIEVSMFRDAPEELLRTSIVMPYTTFRKWLATIAAGRRVDTPPRLEQPSHHIVWRLPTYTHTQTANRCNKTVDMAV